MTFGNDCKVLGKDPDRYGGFQELMLSFSSRDPNAVAALTSSIWTLENYRSEGFPEQDIWSLGTLDQGSARCPELLGRRRRRRRHLEIQVDIQARKLLLKVFQRFWGGGERYLRMETGVLLRILLRTS